MRSIRISIICITFILLMLGLITVYSSSAIYASESLGDSMFFLKRHLLFLGIGFAVSLAALACSMDFLREHSRVIMYATLGLLVLVFVPGFGKMAGGARRWIDFWMFNVQPSEMAKITLVLYLADYISRRESRMENLLYGYAPPLFVIGLTMGLVILQPDLGTAVSIGFIGLFMLFIGGARVRHIVTTVLLSVPVVYYLISSSSYRKRRILAFIDPWLDERGTGFQIVQSFIALGSGGFLGVGLGQSRQKLFFLPASHTDFVFSIIGEELGFLGTVCVLVLFFALIWQGARAAFKIEDTFRKMFIFGIVFTIAFEVIINVGVATGVLPTKGLPLPFISYGGTSLVVHMAAISLILNVMRD
ncbi:MAG: putative lipid II flippase FtsW [Candidatus Omnitrophota bacterium]